MYVKLIYSQYDYMTLSTQEVNKKEISFKQLETYWNEKLDYSNIYNSYTC